MLKKTGILFLILISFATYSFSESDPVNIKQLQSYLKNDAKAEFEPVIDLLSTGLNNGIFAPVSGHIISFGIQANIVPIKQKGILKNANLSSLIVPFAYAGIRIPRFGINIFARGMTLSYKNKNLKIIGLGGGWEPDFIPLINTKLIVHYHTLKNFPYLEGKSLGGTIIASLSTIPLITPFCTLGFNNTDLSTPKIKVLDETVDF